MISLLLYVKKDGYIGYQTDNNSLRVLGEFFCIDVVRMPDFMRALLSACDDEDIMLNACKISTIENTAQITPVHRKNLPTISITKKHLIDILDIVEDLIMRKYQLKTIYFHEDDLSIDIVMTNSHKAHQKEL